MMGSKSSKPVVKPPADWERQEVRRPFEVISPCSDISNPSDFNRVRYHRKSHEYKLEPPPPPHQRQQSRKNGAGAKQGTPFDQNKPIPRRVSNKSSGSNPHNIPVAVKVRRSNSTRGTGSEKVRRNSSSTTGTNSGGDKAIAPGAFYFPTKESERRADRLAKRELRADHQEIAIKAITSNKKKDRNKSRMITTNMNRIITTSIKENIKNIDIKQKTKSIRRGARKAARKMKKKKDTFTRIAIAVANACLEETKNMRLEEAMAANTKTDSQLIASQTSETYPLERKNSALMRRTRRRSEIIAPGDLGVTTGRKQIDSRTIVKKEDDEQVDSFTKEQERHQNQMDRVTSVALHQEDVYFARLSLSPSAQHGASPCAQNGGNNRVTSILGSIKPGLESRTDVETTPVDHRQKSVDSTMDTPVSDLFSANGSLPDKRDDDCLNASIKNKQNNSSPVSSLMRFYTKTGPMELSPKSYFSNEEDKTFQVFADEHSDSSSDRKGKDATIGSRQSLESNSSLYTVESMTYKKVDGKDLKLLVHDNEVDSDRETDTFSSYSRSVMKTAESKKSSTKKKSSKPKVSKLESLFRPILPALSTDDAQSQSSYDPYEIKVTESAPGIIQAANYMSLGARRSSSSSRISVQSRKNNFTSGSPSMSVLSIDTQREPSPTLSKKTVSNQANLNSDFLFTDDSATVVVAQDPNERNNSATISISTAGARSRLANKSTQKGVAILRRNEETEFDGISVDNSSLKSERRVRFSKDSVRLVPTQEPEKSEFENVQFVSNFVGRSHEETPEDEPESSKNFGERVNEQELKSIGEEPYLSLQDAKHDIQTEIERVDSVAESIDLPEVKSNMAIRRSSESVRSIRSNDSFPESILEEEEEEREEASPDSVHWTYSKNGVTPFVPGRSAANPAKSPFYRYQNAKTKFNTQDLIVKSKSPKKSPAKILRKGSGGLVSLRVQELNTRVTEVRKLKRMRKKMTNPRLHTHNFDNTQPVRSRALMNYKTNFSAADLEKSNNMMAAKFNVIPDVDDDDDSTFSAELIPNIALEKGSEDDDASRMSETTGVTSIATIRQHRDSSGLSMSSRSTASSGLSNLKKQVFRVSEGTKSRTSTSDSTTISSMIQEENENYLPFRSTSKVVKPNEQYPAVLHLSPSKGTPAMKWRSLAAKAAEMDALKASSCKPRKGLAIRNMNHGEALP